MAARSLNKVALIGNLATDPELKYTANGSMVCTFVIATNRRYTKSDGTIAEEAEFTPIVAWGKLAEVCQKILGKGMLAYVEGRMKTNQWEGPDGTKRYKTEVRSLEVILLDSKGREPVGMPGEDSQVAPRSQEGSRSGTAARATPARDKAQKAEISDDELADILAGSSDEKEKEDKEEKDKAKSKKK